MERAYGKITIRNAAVADAPLLCRWWNDGDVMAHAGFPLGLGTTEAAIAKKIGAESDDTVRRHIILYDGIPIGEMNYRNRGGGVAVIGIKICEAEYQDRGLGKQILSLFIDGLFHERSYKKIVLDTDLQNRRARHVYERLGFQMLRVNRDSWKDQLGNWRSSVDYELTEERFVSFL